MTLLQTPLSKISFASLTHRGQYTDNYPLGIAMVAAYVKQHFGKSIEVEITNPVFIDPENERLFA